MQKNTNDNNRCLKNLIKNGKTTKIYCWFNLKNEVSWLPYKFIEIEKLS